MEVPSPDIHRLLDIDLAIPTPGEATADFDVLPASRAVCVFENAAGETVLVAVTANLKHFVRQRLGPSGERGPGGPPRAELAPVVDRVRAASCGSPIDSYILYMRVCRLLQPETYRAATEQWSGWFLHVDPGAAHPRWAKVSTRSMDGAGSGVHVGPFPDKHAAGRYAEAMDELFDLCRYHHLLVQAPDATACAYKEMGKCPAPCDGSETMESYRSRVAEAARFADRDPEALARDLEQRMRGAAERRDFEEASRLKSFAERSARLGRGPFRWARTLDRLAWVIVTRSERDSRRRLLVARSGSIVLRADVPTKATRRDLDELASEARRSLATPAVVDSDGLGLLSWWLYRRSRREVMEAIDPDHSDSLTGEYLRSLVQRHARKRGSDDGGESLMEVAPRRGEGRRA